jgi:CheY-like chemotaxis protein
MSQLKLLVVDDDPTNLALMKELLQQLKAEVTAIGESPLAAQIIEREKFDGILLDLTMPILSGYDLAKQVRESSCNRSTPIAIVTGRDDRDAMHKSFSLGATYFLHKPVNKQQIAELLNDFRSPRYDNRRQFTRVPLSTEVTCLLGSKTLHGVIWNISQGGVQLEVEGLQQGDTVHMSFLLSHIVIKAEGMVVWTHEDRRGLIFTDMSIENQEAIRVYVAKTGS